MPAITKPNDSDDIMEFIDVVSVSSAMRQSYLDYSLQVIVNRALPDMRDGLKPVHRRILYAMYESGFTFDKPYRKSARAVGDIMGKYHPHGDASIYEAMVALGQHWTTNAMLIDPQGNFGNIDGDSPAAMRYTEARLSAAAMSFFDDIEKNTVPWLPNYDETEQEPTVLPIPYPNLLVNGSSGIAVGIACEMMPHNMREVIEATKILMADPDAPAGQVLAVLKGPDFPTAGIVHGLDGFANAFETGSGRIYNRARYEIEQRSGRAEQIVVTEIPHRVIKSDILLQIKELVSEKKVEGIVDLADESNRDGIRIVIAIRRDESAEAIMAQLFKMTSLEVSRTYNCTTIENNQPVKQGLRYILNAWIAFRRQVIHDRTIYLREKAQAEHHIYEGYRKALDRLDEVIALIRNAGSQADAKDRLIQLLEVSEIQADKIINLRLGRLTAMELERIMEELREITARIAHLTSIVESPAMIDEIICLELDKAAASFGRPRQSEIAHGLSSITAEDMIPREDVVVMMTTAGYVKRLPTSAITTQNRGTRGKSGISVGEGDRIAFLRECHSHDLIMAVTASGQAMGIKAYQIPETPAQSRGRHIRNVIPGLDEEILTVLTIPDLSPEQRADCDEERGSLFSIVSLSKKGIIRRTPITDFTSITRGSGIRGLQFREGDAYAACFVMHRDDDLLITGSNGKTIRLSIASINEQSRLGTGVVGMKLPDDADVIGASVIPGGRNEGQNLVLVTEKGLGKRTLTSEFEVQNRGGQGNYLLKANVRKLGRILKADVVPDGYDIVFMTANGVSNRLSVGDLRVVGRVTTSGVILVRLDQGDQLVDFAVVSPEDDQNDIATTEG